MFFFLQDGFIGVVFLQIFVMKKFVRCLLYILVLRYGRILSVCPYYSSHCAFINYADHIAPGKAMKALQGTFVGRRNILIKFPDNAANQTNKRTKAA